MVKNITIATPSLNNDSPSTMTDSFLEAPNSLKVAKTAIGSVGEISAPNNKQYTKFHCNQKYNVNSFETKKCPHCGYNITDKYNRAYIICGYNDEKKGYDWNGCGKDWCFRCEKILCKSWETHALHLEMNRSHNDECCSKHAKENNNKYPDDYCQCRNINITRTSNDIFEELMKIL